jgi:H+/Cl- antiporter ClcA
MTDASAPAASPGDAVRSRQFVVLLFLAAIVGVVASLAAWGFLQLIYYMQVWVYTDLPDFLGFGSTPVCWSLPFLALAGLATAFAIVRLPGTGGHEPTAGLAGGLTPAVNLPGVLLAALAGIGFGIVLGPEAPLMALGSGIGFLLIRTLKKDAPEQVGQLLATSGMFAALSFLFGSPVIAAVILVEAAAPSKQQMPLVLIPGLLAAGIGSLVSIGMNSWTGLDSSNISLGSLPLEQFARPDYGDIAWTIPLAVTIALGTFLIFFLARHVREVAEKNRFLVLPAAGVVVGLLAIAFSEITGKGFQEVLFSGQESVSSLVSDADSWSLSALALLIAFKGLAYSVSLGSFRGGPVFPALFLGTAAGLMAGQLPGFEVTPAVAVCIGAAIVAILRLPLAAVVLATLFTLETGAGSMPLIIVAVAVAYLTTLLLDRARPADPQPAGAPAPTAAGP